ncbi:cobalt-precorrin-5B (C(1))-methyltransferase [Fodinicurvata fenggangensis]|uniref:cobalt-precorrin-5B (C(1))-methyltransferase n=1 Tax=Fodinicurvata fenggangensis TaxID=1121830 RepID=UPI00047D7397|nr:cobalt-precorrin-5B (C(1))-methyltransferase [Fodinicurvata fenggangensis]
MTRKPEGTLRRGWTTGACATAATKAACTALFDGRFPDPVQITLPKGETPSFPLAYESLQSASAAAGIIKDAGDDPDVTHGALIISTVRPGPANSGLVFHAGPGVGTVTLEGLPVPVGEAAINPVPRQLMTAVAQEVSGQKSPSLEIEISIPEGEQLAEKTWNPRLGILGGLSILGTTGVVHPFSCAAWIHSIHRGIDVARAKGLQRVAGCTGSTSEKTVQQLYGLPDHAMLDMGDFAGGMLKYLRRQPVPQVTIGGGFAKLVKLAQGFLDLHSGRSQVDFDWLAAELATLGASSELLDQVRQANTAGQVLILATAHNLPIATQVAERARQTATEALRNAPCEVDIVVVDRQGQIVGRSHA